MRITYDALAKKIQEIHEKELELMNKRAIETIESILPILDEHGVLMDDDVYPNVNQKDCLRLFDIMLRYGKEPTYDIENPFDHQYRLYRYKKRLIALFIMNGQGTTSRFEIPEQSIVDATKVENIMDFEDFVQSYFESLKNEDELCRDMVEENKKQEAIIEVIDGKQERIHTLKLVEPFFTDVKEGRKTFEVRLWDRDYQVGDVLTMRLFDKQHGLMDEQLVMRVTSLLSDTDYVKEGYVILSIQALI